MDQPRNTVRAASILVAGGVGFALLAGAVLVVAFVRARQGQTPTVEHWPLLAMGIALIVLLLLAGMSIFLAVGLRHLSTLQQAIARLEQDVRVRSAEASKTVPSSTLGNPSTTPSTQSSSEFREVARLLQEMRDLLLLPEDERRRRAIELAENDLARAESEVRYFIAEGDFPRAETAARQIAERRPDDPRADSLLQEIDVARQQREEADLAGITQEVNDLISMSAWSQARKMVQELQEKHPDNPEARQLMIRIEREYRIAQDEQRRRLYAEVQRFVSRKRWEEAKAAAYAFVERFAGSDDAEAVRLQLPTLELNAEIETRQRLEAEIMDLVKHGRYIDATGLARRVIEHYPDSPQADALRQQIGRLEELATNPAAPPARVRID